MSFRVTSNGQIDRSVFDIQEVSGRLQSVQNDLSTGKRIHRPSDDPTANARAMVLKTTIAQNEQYKQNIDSAKGFVSVSDTATTSYIDALQRLRNLAVQGASGNLRTEDKAAIATEVGQLREEIRGIANTQYNGRYVFGGLKTDQQPYPVDVTLSPNDKGQFAEEIAPGITMNYNISGVSMFGDTTPANNPPGVTNGNIFAVIDNFTALLGQGTSTPDISQQSIQQIDDYLKTAGNNRTTLGGWSNRLDVGAQRLTDVNTSLTNILSSTEDTDIASASLKMNQHQATLQAALSVGAKAMPLTLVDFLK
jgi:flagellar hook-associated protein 3 FlgL